MPPVFGRSLPDPHPYNDALDEWVSAASAILCALAKNIQYDHRVSEKREGLFDGFVDKPVTSDGLRKALTDYFWENIRLTDAPEFLSLAMNGTNLVTMIDPDVKLVRVLDIDGLKGVFNWAVEQSNYLARWGFLKDYPPIPDSLGPDGKPVYKQWLDSQLKTIEGASESEQNQFIEALLDLMNLNRIEHYFQPVWATTRAMFEDCLAAGPDRWVGALGVYKDPDRWQLVLEYSVDEAGTIVRPTFLDSGGYEFHFPSPPQVPLSVGGHPMDLQTLPPGTELRPEYLHKQIDHHLRHWINAGRKLGQTKAVPCNLKEQRQAHYQLLASHYPIKNWMQNPICDKLSSYPSSPVRS